MPGQSYKFIPLVVVDQSRLVMRVILGLLVALVWASTAKSQEPPALPAIAVVETNLQTPAKASAPMSDLSDPPAGASDLPVEAMFPHLSDSRFWLSGQANFIFQTNPHVHKHFGRIVQPHPRIQRHHPGDCLLVVGTQTVLSAIGSVKWWERADPEARS
jgi:hypothetical protein